MTQTDPNDNAIHDREILGIAIDVRRGFRRFIDVPAVDRPAVAARMALLTDAKLQEMLGTRAPSSGFGTASHSRVG